MLMKKTLLKTSIFSILFLSTSAFNTSVFAAEKIVLKATNPNGETALIVNFQVKKQNIKEFEKIFNRSIMCSRLEPGNIIFNLHPIVDNEGSYALYEIWRSPEALQSHFERPYTKALFAFFESDTLEKPIDMKFVGEIFSQKRSSPVAGDPKDVPECR